MRAQTSGGKIELDGARGDVELRTSGGSIRVTRVIGDIEARITRWYETNPGKGSTPVMAVVWQDIVKGKR